MTYPIIPLICGACGKVMDDEEIKKPHGWACPSNALGRDVWEKHLKDVENANRK